MHGYRKYICVTSTTVQYISKSIVLYFPQELNKQVLHVAKRNVSEKRVAMYANIGLYTKNIKEQLSRSLYIVWICHFPE